MNDRRRFPDAGALSRARTLLLAAKVDVSLDTWAELATLCDTGWLAVPRRLTATSVRTVRRHLRRLGSAPQTLAAAADAPGGDIVHLRGVCGALGEASPGASAGAVLWSVTPVRDGDGLWLVEHRNDFALTDGAGDRLYVVAAGGYLVNAPELRAGDEVSVFGILDLVPDRAGLARRAARRGGVAPALRSGSELPLLVRLIRRYAQEDGPRN